MSKKVLHQLGESYLDVLDGIISKINHGKYVPPKYESMKLRELSIHKKFATLLYNRKYISAFQFYQKERCKLRTEYGFPVRLVNKLLDSVIEY